MKKWLKTSLVLLFACIVTAIGIDASDTLSGSGNTLLGQVIGTSTEVCPKGMSEVKTGLSFTCIDTYEASAGSNCPHQDVDGDLKTQENLNESACVPESKENVRPWRYVSLTQAQNLCARAGKRLPKNDEWFLVANSMTSQNSCAIDVRPGEPVHTGVSSCTTPHGVHDMVGNLWEWVDGQVEAGSYKGRVLPQSGYIGGVDTEGVVTATQPEGANEYGGDYAWTDTSGVRGIIRGGFYGSGEDAGMYTQNMAVPLDFKTAGLGFRCVK